MYLKVPLLSQSLKLSNSQPGCIESQLLTFLWKRYHQWLPDIELNQKNASFRFLFQNWSLFYCWKASQGLKLWRNSRTPENDHLHVYSLWVTVNTVRASNFGPHGNFGPFLGGSVASLDESWTKNEQNRMCRSKVFLQLLFSSFFCRMRFNDSKPFSKRGPKFPWGPKLGALTVTVWHPPWRRLFRPRQCLSPVRRRSRGGPSAWRGGVARLSRVREPFPAWLCVAGWAAVARDDWWPRTEQELASSRWWWRGGGLVAASIDGRRGLLWVIGEEGCWKALRQSWRRMTGWVAAVNVCWRWRFVAGWRHPHQRRFFQLVFNGVLQVKEEIRSITSNNNLFIICPQQTKRHKKYSPWQCNPNNSIKNQIRKF